MTVEVVNSHSKFLTAWEAFAKKHRLVFNGNDWLQVYQNKGVNPCVLLNNNNEVIGCFTYFRYRKSGFTFVITPPYAPHIELFYVNPAESVVGKNTFDKEVTECIAVYLRTLSYDYLNLNLPTSIVDTQPFIWQKFNSRNRFTYVIDLSLNEEQLWNRLSSEKRKSIKKAEKDGLSIEATANKQVIYDLVLKSLGRNNKAKNASYIANILHNYANNTNSMAFVAKHGNDYLAVAFCLFYGNKAMYLFGGFDADNKHHGAHVSCMWQCICTAAKMGFAYFDFEGSMNQSIERYFREFGGEIKSYACIENVKPAAKLFFKLRGGLPV